MCGIAGMILIHGDFRHTKTNQDKMIRLFNNMLLNAQAQGTDATGVFSGFKVNTRWDEGKILYTKGAMPASKFVKTIPYYKVAEESLRKDGCLYAIGHTRQATCGSPRDNKNNHPFYCGKILGVHNGIIGNHAQVAEDYGLDMESECDSEVIFQLFDQLRTANHPMSDSFGCLFASLEGWYAGAMVSEDRYNEVILFRDRTSLHLFHHAKEDMLLFATQERWITDALKDSELGGTLDRVDFPTDSALTIDTWKKAEQAIKLHSCGDDGQEEQDDGATFGSLDLPATEEKACATSVSCLVSEEDVRTYGVSSLLGHTTFSRAKA